MEKLGCATGGILKALKYSNYIMYHKYVHGAPVFMSLSNFLEPVEITVNKEGKKYLGMQDFRNQVALRNKF